MICPWEEPVQSSFEFFQPNAHSARLYGVGLSQHDGRRGIQVAAVIQFQRIAYENRLHEIISVPGLFLQLEKGVVVGRVEIVDVFGIEGV